MSRKSTISVEAWLANLPPEPQIIVVEAAKQDGRWNAAYASQKNISVPEDFQAALAGNKKAKVFFASLKSAERYSFLFRIQTAKKPETRAKLIQKYVEMLEKNEKIHLFKPST